MSIIVLITARMKSTRLPKKALLGFNGKTLIEYQVERLRSIKNIRLIICTSWLSEDDPLVGLAKKIGVEFFRDEPDDVLTRYFNCASKLNLNHFLITYSDEPFLDLKMIKDSFKIISESQTPLWIDNSNSIDGTFCYGLNKEALNIMLNKKESTDTEVWGELANRLKIPKTSVKQNFFTKKNNVRLTIDYEEDFEVFKILAKQFFNKTFNVELYKILEFYIRSELYKINLFRSNDYLKRLRVQSQIS